ncbi:hypothetical protein [Planktothrix prolifica]|uniref:hypothetical protein n=1 Tax=Planktothrix prolifica TaxID=54307 RepID=UPI00130E9CC3|nr:hypothetical protein [Planktothrix prolifica]
MLYEVITYGLVGLLLFTAQEDSLIVRYFFTSVVGVLGRGVEHQMLAYLGTVAQKKD